MNVKRIEAAGKLVQLKIGETDLSVVDARELAKTILGHTDPAYSHERLVHDLARAIYPRSWEDHGAIYEPNTSVSIAKSVVQKVRQAGWTLVKLRRGDFPV